MSHNTEVNVSKINGFDQYDELYQWSKNRVTKIKVDIIGVHRNVKITKYSTYFPYYYQSCHVSPHLMKLGAEGDSRQFPLLARGLSTLE